MNRGFLFALAAYLSWGFLPIYWKTLQTIPALEILGHRIVWSLLFLGGVLTLRRDWEWLTRLPRRTLLTFAAVAGLIGLNWFTYIWAVNASFVVETSLGYFINPLVNVLLGFLFLGERLRRLQWLAVLVAAGGVIYLTIDYGRLPWIALTLAATFGVYGLLKKQVSLAAFRGLTLEMLFLLLPGLAYLFYLGNNGLSAVPTASAWTVTLLVGTGVITTLPLLAFAAAANRITLTSLGIMQYLAPSIQLCLGIFLYNEPFDLSRLLGFGFIWTALLIYTVEALYVNQNRRRQRRRERVSAQAS